ncbi:hypothetical protein JOC77_003672 [Peribacillus deserti]|uniref:Multidrug ABC transporter ATPase n=1 Tax=Peribacillus deserti TaxID=673318 RepID=A0ABS2QM37_9BACI|nr:hypothetical protein [Peribacillus deserti]MBM7694228.1 hypothetical protein [Peribacillus deserti]
MKEYVKPDQVPENSSMARNLAEMKNLGKQMENMRSNEELISYGKSPDPVQHEEELKNKEGL